MSTRAPSPTRRSRQWRVDQCRAGRLPAEALDTADREHLLYDLWQLGWTDAAIAAHTAMTTYTTARIRSRLGLRPRHPWECHPATGAA